MTKNQKEFVHLTLFLIYAISVMYLLFSALFANKHIYGLIGLALFGLGYVNNFGSAVGKND